MLMTAWELIAQWIAGMQEKPFIIKGFMDDRGKIWCLEMLVESDAFSLVRGHEKSFTEVKATILHNNLKSQVQLQRFRMALFMKHGCRKRFHMGNCQFNTNVVSSKFQSSCVIMLNNLYER